MRANSRIVGSLGSLSCKTEYSLSIEFIECPLTLTIRSYHFSPSAWPSEPWTKLWIRMSCPPGSSATSRKSPSAITIPANTIPRRIVFGMRLPRISNSLPARSIRSRTSCNSPLNALISSWRFVTMLDSRPTATILSPTCISIVFLAR